MDRISVLLEKFSHLMHANSLGGTAVQAVLAIVLTLVVWISVTTVLRIAYKRLQFIDVVRTNEQLFMVVRKALSYVLLLAVSNYLIGLFKLQFLQKLIPALFMILFAGPIQAFLLIVLKYMENKWVEKTETKVDDIIFDLLNKFSGAIVYSVAIILALDILGINVMPFIAGAGILGVAVGFAAKDTLSNLIAGILLIIDRPFEVGDRIEVWSAPAGSATWGDVIDIGLRATKIKTTDNIIIVIPNNEIMRRDIVNYTLLSSDIRVRINIGVAYDTDVEKAKAAILSVANEVEWILKSPAPKVVVRNFGESSIDLQLRVWIKDARMRMDTISFVTDRVKSAFDAQGIEIPYPKRDITIISKKSHAESGDFS